MAKSRESDHEEEYAILSRGIDLAEDGDLAKAETLLVGLTEGPYGPEAKLALGVVFQKQDRVIEAVELFSSLVVELPDSEGASLGLFHSLWRADRREEAFLEMKRFLASYQSWEYRRLRRDLKEEGYLVPS